jgi:ZIP family zinc transporter
VPSFGELHPVLQVLVAGIFMWPMTAVGASFVFFMRTMSRKVLDVALG